MKIKTKIFVTLLPIILIPLIGVGLLSIISLRMTSQDIDNMSTATQEFIQNSQVHAENVVARFDEIVRTSYELLAMNVRQSFEDICMSKEQHCWNYSHC